jgi:hypothetical protein
VHSIGGVNHSSGGAEAVDEVTATLNAEPRGDAMVMMEVGPQLGAYTIM